MENENMNKNQWVVWAIAIGAIIITLFAFNYQGDKAEVVPLSEIFPEEEIEYEFVDTKPVKAPQKQASAPQPKKMAAPAPAAPQEAPKPTSKLEPQKKIPYYTIQALSSVYKDRTEKELAKIKEKGYPAFINTKTIEGKGTWYQIYIGKFEKMAEANAYLPKVKEDFSDCFIRLVK